MRLARRDDVLDVALTGRSEAGAGVGPVDRPQRPDDVLLDELGVGLVALPLVGRAAVLGGYGEAAPRLGGHGSCKRDPREHDEDPAPQARTAMFTSDLCSRSLVSSCSLHLASSWRRRFIVEGYQHLRCSLSSRGSDGRFAMVNIVAGKVVELSPPFDHSGTTGLAGSR